MLTESISESKTSRSTEKYEYNDQGLLIFQTISYEFISADGRIDSTSTVIEMFVYEEDESDNVYYYYHLSDSPFDSVTAGTFTVNNDRQLTSVFLDYGYGYTSKTEWEYDDNGNLLVKRYSDGDEVLSLQVYTYDADGNETSVELYMEGKLVSTSEKHYDGGQITHIDSVSYDDNGNVESRSYGTAKYDSHGNMTELTYYSYDDDSETARYEYIYDEHGNCLEIIQYRDGEEVSHVYNSYKAIKLPKD